MTRPSPEVFRRRRLVAAGLLLLVVAGAIVALQVAVGRVGGGPLTTTDAGGRTAAASARVWVVQPGQTLWGIASAIDPHGDARPVVARLEAATGSATFYPGERIPIP